jgi:predicted ArsR family transcriptional regulator
MHKLTRKQKYIVNKLKGGARTVLDIAEQCEISRSAAYNHLYLLVEAGAVRASEKVYGRGDKREYRAVR